MAFFGVTVETLEKVWNHPNADKLDLAKAKGLAFQFVVGRGQFKEGQKVCYFPIDSVLPSELIEKMGMTGKFSGTNKNRIKTLKLRQEVSQGFVIEPHKILPEEMLNKTSEEITAFLGVEKYEPPVTLSKDGFLVQLPEGCSKYDIEGADRFQHIIDLLMDQEVVISEKMEGTNHSVFKNEESKLFVNQRNFSIIEKEGSSHSYWEVARRSGLIAEVSKREVPTSVYSEYCGPGVQGNIYKLPDATLFIFDIKVNNKWLSFEDFKKEIELIKKNSTVEVAPILFQGKLKDFLNGKTVQEMSNGKSVVNPQILREGIVIKPVNEQYHPELGRLIIKQRSPEYLANEK